MQGDIHIPNVRATDDPASLGPVDLVIFSVKLWDTEDAARQIAPIVHPGTAVLSLQNGVMKDDILRRFFSPDQVMGGVCYVASHIGRPGVINQTGTMQRIVVGDHSARCAPTRARAPFSTTSCARWSPSAEHTAWRCPRHTPTIASPSPTRCRTT